MSDAPIRSMLITLAACTWACPSVGSLGGNVVPVDIVLPDCRDGEILGLSSDGTSTCMAAPSSPGFPIASNGRYFVRHRVTGSLAALELYDGLAYTTVEVASETTLVDGVTVGPLAPPVVAAVNAQGAVAFATPAAPGTFAQVYLWTASGGLHRVYTSMDLGTAIGTEPIAIDDAGYVWLISGTLVIRADASLPPLVVNGSDREPSSIRDLQVFPSGAFYAARYPEGDEALVRCRPGLGVDRTVALPAPRRVGAFAANALGHAIFDEMVDTTVAAKRVMSDDGAVRNLGGPATMPPGLELCSHRPGGTLDAAGRAAFVANVANTGACATAPLTIVLAEAAPGGALRRMAAGGDPVPGGLRLADIRVLGFDGAALIFDATVAGDATQARRAYFTTGDLALMATNASPVSVMTPFTVPTAPATLSFEHRFLTEAGVLNVFVQGTLLCSFTAPIPLQQAARVATCTIDPSRLEPLLSSGTPLLRFTLEGTRESIVIDDIMVGGVLVPNGDLQQIDPQTHLPASFGGSSVALDYVPAGNAPIVGAGDDQTVAAGALVTLSGFAASRDSTAVTVTWTQVEGPAVALSDPASSRPTFTAPSVQASLRFVLTALGSGGSSQDAVRITVSAPPPPPPDADGDGVPDSADNCPSIANAGQEDADADARGDACDVCPRDALDDGDADGLCADADNCAAAANPDQADLDGDGAGDACDADDDGDGVLDAADDCPDVADPDQADLDGDGIGDACDPDADGDAVLDEVDNCPGLANADQRDRDGDGVGDACDDSGPPAACPIDAGSAPRLAEARRQVAALQQALGTLPHAVRAALGEDLSRADKRLARAERELDRAADAKHPKGCAARLRHAAGAVRHARVDLAAFVKHLDRRRVPAALQATLAADACRLSALLAGYR